MQVKFRGKRKGGNEWLIGDLSHVNGGTYIIPTEDAPLNSPDWFEVEPSSIGMFTGLTDKNGKEIYGAVGESGGDITKSKFGHSEPYVIKYGEFTDEEDDEYKKCTAIGFYFFSEEETTAFGKSIKGDMKYLEIIGNAFDNHELLNKK